jgi:PAS domain-containing protein
LRKKTAQLEQEIAERKRAEEAVRESEEMARVILNAVYDVALLTDPDGTIVALNETAAKSLGKSPSVGFDLIQNMVRQGLRGGLSLHNDDGAVAVIRFKA